MEMEWEIFQLIYSHRSNPPINRGLRNLNLHVYNLFYRCAIEVYEILWFFDKSLTLPYLKLTLNLN